jgi:hypothetical protein
VLGTVYPSAQAAIALIKQIGIIPGWDQYWDRYFLYELRDVNGGVAASTERQTQNSFPPGSRTSKRLPSATKPDAAGSHSSCYRSEWRSHIGC